MILMDSGAIYALIDKNDKNHLSAKKYYSSVVGKEIFVTTVPVITESWLLLSARLGNYFADKIWEPIDNSVFEVLDIERDDFRKAFEIEKKYSDVHFGFIDSTSFAICEKYRIRKVFTFDIKHFSIYRPGFVGSLQIYPG
ncbi:MAG: PIN domain-containing protein [Actinobacteria bacterium]|nr:PIN domain-containing protein [Actinomycetota bacterium]